MTSPETTVSGDFSCVAAQYTSVIVVLDITKEGNMYD